MVMPRTEANGKIVPRNKDKNAEPTLIALVQKKQDELANALPQHVNPKRMLRIVVTALRNTPKLVLCEPLSFLGSMMSCAQLGLEPNTPLGHAYLIPRKNRHRPNILECTLQIGYQGMMELSRRSGLVRTIYAYDVRAGDTFSFQLGLNPDIKHEWSDAADREHKPITHVYAVAKLKDGEPVFRVLTLAQIEARRARSAAAKDGPWVTDYEAMAHKTAIRALWKWLPKSSELARAIALDEAPEYGGSQRRLWEPDLSDGITRLLEAEGIEAPADDGDESEATEAAEAAEEVVNPETGEVTRK